MNEGVQKKTETVTSLPLDTIDRALVVSQGTSQTPLFVLGACLSAADPISWLSEGINRIYLARALGQTPKCDQEVLIQKLLVGLFPQLSPPEGKGFRSPFLSEFNRVAELSSASLSTCDVDELARCAFSEELNCRRDIKWHLDTYTGESHCSEDGPSAREELLKTAQLEFNAPDMIQRELFLSHSIQLRSHLVSGSIPALMRYNLAAQLQGEKAWTRFVNSELVNEAAQQAKELIHDIPKASLPGGMEALTVKVWACVEAMAHILIHVCEKPLPLKKMGSKLNLLVQN